MKDPHVILLVFLTSLGYKYWTVPIFKEERVREINFPKELQLVSGRTCTEFKSGSKVYTLSLRAIFYFVHTEEVSYYKTLNV